MNGFAVVIEDAGSNFSAYVHDLPGCVATGPTQEATKETITEAMAMHIAGLREDGLPVPVATSRIEYV